jgi:hypothetical protein
MNPKLRLMKNLLIVGCIVLCMSCGNSMKLAIPSKFAEQAVMMEVKGARSKHVSFGNYKTSKIRRGWQMKSSRYGNRFFFDNLLLQSVGIRKNEIITKEKDKFRFILSDGAGVAEVHAQELEANKTLDYKIGKGTGLLESFSRLQQYQYLLTATIATDTSSMPWQMILSNAYDRNNDSLRNRLFTIIKETDNGLATNGTDTIIIRPLNIQKATLPNNKEGKLPMKMLSGYELRIDDGVVAIIDNIGKNIWFYKELDSPTRLVIASIATTILVKRVKDVKW